MRLLRLLFLPVEEVDTLLYGPHLLHQPVVRGVPAQLHVRPVGPGLQTGLGHLQGRPLGPDGLVQAVNVFLLVVDLLETRAIFSD